MLRSVLDSTSSGARPVLHPSCSYRIHHRRLARRATVLHYFVYRHYSTPYEVQYRIAVRHDSLPPSLKYSTVLPHTAYSVHSSCRTTPTAAPHHKPASNFINFILQSSVSLRRRDQSSPSPFLTNHSPHTRNTQQTQQCPIVSTRGTQTIGKSTHPLMMCT